MESIPVENLNLETLALKIAFDGELDSMVLELKQMDKEREKYVKTIRDKIRKNIKNGYDAISYLPKYLELTIDFDDYKFEVINGINTLCLMTDDATIDGVLKIGELAEKLCKPYLKIGVDSNYDGYMIEYRNKKEKSKK